MFILLRSAQPVALINADLNTSHGLRARIGNWCWTLEVFYLGPGRALEREPHTCGQSVCHTAATPEGLHM